MDTKQVLTLAINILNTHNKTILASGIYILKVNPCILCKGEIIGSQPYGPIKEFNFARKDYDGDGVIDGVQSEVQHLLDNLSRGRVRSRRGGKRDQHHCDCESLQADRLHVVSDKDPVYSVPYPEVPMMLRNRPTISGGPLMGVSRYISA